MKAILTTVIAFVIMCITTISQAQVAPMDSTFGLYGNYEFFNANVDQGYIDMHVNKANNSIYALCLESVNTINQVYIKKHNSNGTVDFTYGMGGKAKITDSMAMINLTKFTILNDGSILLVGGYADSSSLGVDACIVKLEPNGAVDLSFGTAGKYVVPYTTGLFRSADDLVVDSADNIYMLCNYFDTASVGSFIAKLDANGAPINSFGTNGIVELNVGSLNIYANAISMLPNNKFIVGGSDFGTFSGGVLAQFNNNGTIDATFGTAGMFIVPSADFDNIMCITPAADGNIVFAGNAESVTDTKLLIGKITTTGTLVNSFGNNGLVRTLVNGLEAEANSLVANKDGSFWLGGNADMLNDGIQLLGKYTATGKLDTTFNNVGYSLNSNIKNCIAIDTMASSSVICAGTLMKNTTDAYNHLSMYKKVNVLVAVPNAIETAARNTTISLFPNPATEYIVVNASTIINSVAIIDMQGKLVSFTKCNNNTANINVQNIAVGNYTAIITTNNKPYTQKLVVVK